MRPTLMLPASILFVLGCGSEGSAEPDGAALPPTNQQFPSIHEVRLPALDQAAIPGLTTRLAVAPSGQVAFVSARRPDDTYRVQLVDSTGRTIVRLGRLGEGPGELRNPLFLAFRSDGRLVAWDIATGRVTAYDTTGASEGIGEVSGILFPLALVGDSIDRRGSDPSAADFRRVALGGGERRLLQGADSAFDALFPVGTVRGNAMRPPPVYAAGMGRIAFGESVQGRILLYSDRGSFLGQIAPDRPSELPTPDEVARESLAVATMPVPAARKVSLLQTYRERPRLHFRSLRFDESGRLWVIGAREDAAYADIYADTTLLGTLILDCPGFAGESWDLAGSFLVMVCAPTDPDAPSDGTLKLFRIEG